jgi:hypothetical protein
MKPFGWLVLIGGSLVALLGCLMLVLQVALWRKTGSWPALSLITVPLPPASGSSIGASVRCPTFHGAPWNAGHHENWGIFKRHI